MLPFKEKSLMPLAREIDDLREIVDSKGPLSRAWNGRLRRDLESEAVAASTMMEGVAVTVDEVRRILSGDKSISVAPLDESLVEGYRQAMGLVLRRADDAHFHWSRELLVNINDRVLAGRYELSAGKLRTSQRLVVDQNSGQIVFTPAHHEKIGLLVDKMCQFIERYKGHPAIASAWVHIAIAAIHPFSDGNGRVARIAAALVMYRSGYKRQEFTSLEEFWGRHRATYYAAFQVLGTRFQEKTDVTRFCQTHMQAQLSQIRALHLREQVERRIWVGIENILSDLNLPERLSNALWDAFFSRNLTAGYYRAVADVSPAGATSDLALGCAAGLLLAKGHRRARHYLAGKELLSRIGSQFNQQIGGEVHEVRTILIARISEQVAGEHRKNRRKKRILKR